MRSKRANGDGSIYKRKDGRWVAQAYVQTSTGAWERRYLYGSTRGEAEQKLAQLREQINSCEPIAPARLTVGDYLTDWVEHVAARRVRHSTLYNYRLYIERHLIPGLGKKPLDRLTAREVRLFLNRLRDSGVGARTVQYTHATLRAALEDAVRDELIARNVARLVRVTRPRPAERQPLTADQARALLKATRDDRLYALFVVLIVLGMRRSEALGLRWEDIDIEGRALQVRHTLHRQDHSLVLLPPKTLRSRRTIPLPAFVAHALVEHRRRQETEKATSKRDWRETGYVFTTGIGTPIDPRNCSRMFASQCARAGVPVVPLHALRHTCVSLLLSMGAPPRVVMEIVGHSALEMTMNVYAHVDLGSRRDALDRLADLFDEDPG
jgi:integrase